MRGLFDQVRKRNRPVGDSPLQLSMNLMRSAGASHFSAAALVTTVRLSMRGHVPASALCPPCKTSAWVSASSERGRDLESHGVERRDEAGDEPEHEHQADRLRHNVTRECKARQQLGDAGAQPYRDQYGECKARKPAQEGEQDRLAENETQNASAREAQRLEHPDLARALANGQRH